MRILDQFPIQLSFRPDRWFNPVPLIAIYASYARKTSFKRDFKLHKIESSQRLDSLMSRAKEHNDLMMLMTLNKTDFWRVLFIIRGALEDFYYIRRHLKLNSKTLSSQLMRLPLTALFLESVMTFL